MKEQYPELDFRFVFQNALNKLSKKSKGTYGTWCKRHGFKYADNSVPDEWIGEIASTLQGDCRESQSQLNVIGGS